MAYDEDTADRIRGLLGQLCLRPEDVLGEIKMFGGLCFTLNGKMLTGVGKGRIMVRMASEALEDALAEGFADPMDFTGKPLANFAYLTEKASGTDEGLLEWIEKSEAFVRSQGKKKK